ncbi:unnamed protein product [Caenorhabditis angaria]|uniref:Serpentine receptor class gamma n=1 Tax=Caenorhabditis angaria TaxID=860376 RepID=A0A9P1ISX8_9PELO|nr:unnamed protein product [Caenorhabditis angaria]
MKLFSMFLLCGNRLTSVTMPVKHSYFWKRHIHHFIIAQIILSAISSTPVFSGRSYAFTYLNQGQVTYIHTIPYFRTSYFRLFFLIPGIFFLIFSNILIIRKISKISGDMEKMQKLMTISTIFMSIGSILAIFLSFVTVAVTPEDLQNMNQGVGEFLLLVTQIGRDFELICGPIILLIMVGKNRKTLLFRKRISNGSSNSRTVQSDLRV